jgi:hypothetical protein
MSHVCYHCKELIPDNVEHDCWTTTERELTKGLSEDLRDAWERIRETALEFGEQRVYASHSSIMFSRKACHFFVRPKKKRLELVVFLGRAVKSPLVRKVVASSKTKRAHLISIVHRDQVEAPITDWMREAYGLEDQSNRRDRRDRRELTDRKPKKTKRKKSP